MFTQTGAVHAVSLEALYDDKFNLVKKKDLVAGANFLVELDHKMYPVEFIKGRVQPSMYPNCTGIITLLYKCLLYMQVMEGKESRKTSSCRLVLELHMIHK